MIVKHKSWLLTLVARGKKQQLQEANNLFCIHQTLKPVLFLALFFGLLSEFLLSPQPSAPIATDWNFNPGEEFTKCLVTLWTSLML